VLINHVQNPNTNDNQKKFQTAGRAELTTSRAKMMSPWKQRLPGLIIDIKIDI